MSDSEGEEQKSFDGGSFDVSHISHVSDSEDEHGGGRHHHQPPPPPAELNSEPSSSPPPASAHAWYTSPSSSYDQFIALHSMLSNKPAPARSPHAHQETELTLEAERARLRNRKSGQFTSDGAPLVVADVVPPPQPAPILQPQPQPQPPQPQPPPPAHSDLDQWSAREDTLLRAAVSVHGDTDWISIAAAFRGARTQKECFARWTQVLDPFVPPPGRSSIEQKSPEPVQPPPHISAHVAAQASAQAALGSLQRSLFNSPSAVVPPAAAHAKPSPLPLIPKLALGQLDKEPAFDPSPPSATSSASATSRPTTAGASTTRSRLTQFNLKLRAARRLQNWWRNIHACAPAKAEAHIRRVELEGLGARARGFQPFGESMGSRVQYDEPPPPATARDKKHSLAHLKEKMASRGAASARRASTSPTGRSPATNRPQTAHRSPADLSFASPAQRRAAAAATNGATFRLFPAYATPALRALVQGFLVRHMMQQKSTRDLIRQIRDVERMIAQVHDERDHAREEDKQDEVHYATYFMKSLRQQMSVLKAQLLELFTPQVVETVAGSSPSPSRVRFDNKTSPRGEYAEHLAKGGAPSGSASARPATASSSGAAMLKRKSQRLFLKKQRPATARPASTRASAAIDPEESWEGDQSAVNESASGASTNRSFLKRKSRKQAGQKLDWSRVGSKVDAKLDGYRAPTHSSHGVLYDSVTGEEWYPPPEPAMDRSRHTSGSQSARNAAPVARRAFKPSGHAGGVLPVVANTDSGAPPLSPAAKSSRSSKSNKQSRHIILEARKLDLSHVTSRVDYRSPYKAEYSPDSDTSFDYAASFANSSNVVSPTKKKTRPQASPYVNLNDVSFDADSFPQPVVQPVRPATARASKPKSKQPTMRHGLTPTRDELRRLDEELARARAEQQEADAAWETHGVRQSEKPQPSKFQFDAPPEEDDEAERALERELRAAEAAYERAVERASPTKARAAFVHHERSSSDPEANLSASFDAASFATSPERQNTSYSAHVSPLHSAYQEPEEESAGNDSFDLMPQPSASPVHHRVSGGSRPTHVARLSQQELMINSEIADIERSLNEMSSFAAARGAARRERERPTTAAAPRAFVPGPELQPEWKRTIEAPEHTTPIHFSASAASPPRGNSPRFAPGPGSPTSAAANGAGAGVTRLTLQFDQLANEVRSFMSSAAPQ